MSESNLAQIRFDVIEKALPDIAFDGWDWNIITKAASSLDISPSTLHAVFPRGLKDVVNSFSLWADHNMLEALNAFDPDEMRVRDRIIRGVLSRYEVLCGHEEAVRYSLNFWAPPYRSPEAGRVLWRTADKIWNWAGDTSTDYNFYTKRSLLCAVIAPTTLVWINEADIEKPKTTAFLDRRIDNVLQLGKMIGKVRSKVARG